MLTAPFPAGINLMVPGRIWRSMNSVAECLAARVARTTTSAILHIVRIPTKKITHSELSAIKSGAAATAIGSESAGTCSII
jgi:hypothetical protein